MTTKETGFKLVLANGKEKFINARICKTITGNLMQRRVCVDKIKRACKALRLADDLPDKDRSYTVDILIGNNYYDDIMGIEKIQIEEGRYLINSSLGWILSGRATKLNSSSCDCEPTMFVRGEDVGVAKQVWDLKTIGIKEHPNDEDAEVMSTSEESMSKLESNDSDFLDRISDEDRRDQKDSKLLGMFRSKLTDMLSIVKLQQLRSKSTKRNILKFWIC